MSPVMHLIKFLPRSDSDLRNNLAVKKLIESYRGNPEHFISLDESWCALHFIITVGEYPIPQHEALRRGMSWQDDSLENVIMGGEPTTYKLSRDYVRYIPPQRVQHIYQLLVAEVSTDVFISRYDPEILDEENMPPGRWSSDPEALTWLLGYFRKLVNFYEAASQGNEGMMIYTV